MSWNDEVIAEFRANEGRVGGSFEGAPITLLHHVGRRSGKEYVAPVMYLRKNEQTIYVFASKGGHPENPEWYANLTAAGRGTVEVGTETYDVTVRDLQGEERDRVFAEQASRYPGFAGYAEKTEGIRVIPVLALTRV